MAHIYKINLLFNLANITKGMNSFVWEDGGIIPTPDSLVLSFSESWITSIFSPLRPVMDSGVTLISATVDELVASTGKTQRHVGTINPTVNGTLGGDSLPFVDTGSCFARTAIPKVRGGKSFAGISETVAVDGLYANSALSALSAATSVWLTGPNAGNFDSGVWSSKVAGFVPFVNQGGTTNVPGTRVSRRPGRGL